MIPDFQTIMLPLLEAFADKQEYKKPALVEIISNKFQLTQEERLVMLPSKNDYLIWNRVGWAMAHLKKAGLLETPKRGLYIITEQGLKVLNSNPIRIDLKFLMNVPKYKQWKEEYQKEWLEKKSSENNNSANIQQEEIETNKTPEELLEGAFSQLKEELAIELIEKIKECSPSFFERLVVDMLIKMGYGGSRKEAGRVIGKSNDGGIDGIINEDKLGLDTIYIQAKKWEGSVGRPEIQKFVGVLAGQGAKKGIFITTSSFSKEARGYHPKNDTKIVLIDGQDLANLMIEHGVGVSTKINYEIKRMDTDYFEE